MKGKLAKNIIAIGLLINYYQVEQVQSLQSNHIHHSHSQYQGFQSLAAVSIGQKIHQLIKKEDMNIHKHLNEFQMLYENLQNKKKHNKKHAQEQILKMKQSLDQASQSLLNQTILFDQQDQDNQPSSLVQKDRKKDKKAKVISKYLKHVEDKVTAVKDLEERLEIMQNLDPLMDGIIGKMKEVTDHSYLWQLQQEQKAIKQQEKIKKQKDEILRQKAKMEYSKLKSQRSPSRQRSSSSVSSKKKSSSVRSFKRSSSARSHKKSTSVGSLKRSTSGTSKKSGTSGNSKSPLDLSSPAKLPDIKDRRIQRILMDTLRKIDESDDSKWDKEDGKKAALKAIADAAEAGQKLNDERKKRPDIVVNEQQHFNYYHNTPLSVGPSASTTAISKNEILPDINQWTEQVSGIDTSITSAVGMGPLGYVSSPPAMNIIGGPGLILSVTDSKKNQPVQQKVDQKKSQEKDDDLPKNNKDIASFLYETVAENNNKIKKIQNRF